MKYCMAEGKEVESVHVAVMWLFQEPFICFDFEGSYPPSHQRSVQYNVVLP